MILLGRLSLAFNKLIFNGFLPENRTDGLRLELIKGQYSVVLYMSDRRKQLATTADIPTSAEELGRYVGLPCRELTMEIEVRNADSELLDDLEAGRITEGTENFGSELSKTVIETYNRLTDYFRNIAKEYWLQPLTLNPSSSSSAQLYFNGWDAHWFTNSGNWRRLLIGQQRDRMEITLPKGDAT